jgi:hypothetical protein
MKLISESVVLHQSASFNQEYVSSGDYIGITAYPTIDIKPIDLGYGDYFFANPRLDLGRNKLVKGIFIKIFCSESKETKLSADGISGVFASLSVDKEKFDTLKFCALNNICLTRLSLSFDHTKLEGIHEHKVITTIDGIEFSIGKEFEYSELSDKKLVDSVNEEIEKKHRFLKIAYHSLVAVALLKIIFFIG